MGYQINATDSYKIESIETLDKLISIKNDWNKLFNSKTKNTIFFSFDVFKIYYEVLTTNFNNVKIKIFIVKNQKGEIITILPFTLEKKSYFHMIPFKQLSLKDEYLIGFYDFLSLPQVNREIIFQKFEKYLEEHKNHWDIIKLSGISEEDDFLQDFKLVFNHDYKIDQVTNETLVIDINQTFNEFIKTNIKGKYFREIRRKMNRLKENGELHFVEMKNKEEILNALTYFYDIEDKNWKGRAGTSLKQAYYGEFYKKLSNHFADQNKVRIYLLKFNDEYIAGLYSIVDRGTCYLLKTGYDERFYKYSPSSILFFLFFEKHFQSREIKKIDFFGPYHQYQRSFGNHTRKKYNLIIYNNKMISKTYNIVYDVWKKIFGDKSPDIFRRQAS
jgi:CelD/BcsL family acetyltransferase involved in cellulose biosynthesis